MSADVWLLGLLAGGTIVLGLPIARLRSTNPRLRGFLNAVSTGILIFLLVEITGHVLEEIEELVEKAVEHGSALTPAFHSGGLFAIGFAFGLLGLVYFERRYLGTARDQLPAKTRAKQLALMIAVGLGLHNFSEGLAIGQGYTSGAIRLAWLLAIGFGLHNATEGFGIAAPLSGHRVSWPFLGLAGLVAGGPTFAGAVVGSLWVSKPVEVFVLALASGTILYIVGELLHLGRQLKEEAVVAIGLLAGFFVAVATDFVLIGAFAQGEVAAARAAEAPTVVVSSHEAEHRPRHGGSFGDADDVYHYEALLQLHGRLVLYVNDEHNHPLDVRPLHGRWTLNPDSASPVTGIFHPSVDGAYFVAQLPPSGPSDVVPVEVAVLKGRTWAEMEFTLAQQQ